jgi:hypothetical protein
VPQDIQGGLGEAGRSEKNVDDAMEEVREASAKDQHQETLVKGRGGEQTSNIKVKGLDTTDLTRSTGTDETVNSSDTGQDDQDRDSEGPSGATRWSVHRLKTATTNLCVQMDRRTLHDQLMDTNTEGSATVGDPEVGIEKMTYPSGAGGIIQLLFIFRDKFYVRCGPVPTLYPLILHDLDVRSKKKLYQ